MKHIKPYDKKYYIIPTENLKQSLININCKQVVIDDILNTIINSTAIPKNKYIYIGTSENWSHPSDWDWMPLEDESDDRKISRDGDYVYKLEKYKFHGYSNLTNKQKKEVLNIKNAISIQNDINKYNL